jgi:hypothetical protein
LFLLKVAAFPSPADSADRTFRAMTPERTSFEEWLARLPFLVRGLVLSAMMLSGAGLVIVIRVALGRISTDSSGLVPILLFVIVIAFLGAWRAGRRS